MMNPYDALLVIDMQLVAFDGKITPPIQDGANVLNRVAELVATCHATGLHIVYVQTCAMPGQPYAKDTHGWEIHPVLASRPGDATVYKVNSNGFEDTDLAEVLAALEVRNLITCGIWSEYCLARTSLAAIERGFNVHVAADAHGTVANDRQTALDTAAQQNKFLEQSNAKVSTVRQLQMLLAELG